MELTRRDAAAALAALGATGGAAYGVHRWLDDPEDLPDDERVREVAIAVAEVVYPDAVTGVGEFVETFLDGRLDRPEHAAGLREAVAALEDRADTWYDAGVAGLSADDRDRLLRETGADTADEDPDGTTAQRVRYYLINDLLLALYSSPAGGELVGIENPQGHPGGTESYQRGPR